MAPTRFTKIPKIPDIPDEERTPLVAELLDICCLQQELILSLLEQIQVLRDEVARLKNQKPKPKIRPSNLEHRPDKEKNSEQESKKRPGSAKRKKNLPIHETIDVPPDNIPEGSRFKGYGYFTIQDIAINPHNTLYRLEHWQTPSGDYIVGKLPREAEDGHFGSTLVSFILYQYYHAHVTQPLIREELLEFGVDISTGQVNRIIIEGKDVFHAEKDSILSAGIEVSGYVHVDDTGARHKGRNGYCTHIGNELFAWFESTGSKSRINFLTLLRGKHTDYVLDDAAFEYMVAQKFPKAQLELLTCHGRKYFGTKQEWESTLKELGIISERHVRIATEGGLFGSVLEHGLNPNLVIISDDAGQFNVFLHALCWIHAERTLNKIVGINDEQREAIEDIKTRFWDLYDDLKAYKEDPGKERKAELEVCFDQLFTTKTCCISLDLALKRIYKNKSELLLVLERPDIPLHNNLSENDIREYVKKRKISGSTRSDIGRCCRDTFTSLKKTCRKLGISFWKYLLDRVSGCHDIALLSEIIRQRASPTPSSA